MNGLVRATLAIVALEALAGCGANHKAPPARPDPPPQYAEIAAAYNARVAPMTQLWARSVVRVWYPDEQGEEQSSQVEGHFVFEPPDRLYLTFNKVSETYAVLGSSAEQYWWLELGEKHRAWIGRHDRVTDERAREVGLPVHPLDLLELLGVLPLPETPSEPPGVAWSPDGRRIEVMVAVRRRPEGGAAGRRIRLALEQESLLPTRIELLDDHDEALMSADLESYEPVKVRGGTGPLIATRFIATLEGGRKRFRLWLYDPERRAPPVGPKVYDWAWLQRTYRIEEVESLDE